MKPWSDQPDEQLPRSIPMSVEPLDLRAEHNWLKVMIPLAEPAVEMLRLQLDPVAKSSTAFVRFPHGWNREVECRYSVDEEIVMLGGELRISGVVIPEGSYGFIPTGVLRTNTLTPTTSLALAWFSGPTGATEHAVDAPIVVADLATVELDQASPLGGPGRLLRSSVNGTCWLLESIPPGTLAPSGASAELCDLAEARWSAAPAGSPLTTSAGRTVVRFTWVG